jgi:hypothetical protein
MFIVITTKGEWQAFRLVIEVIRQKRDTDMVLIWDDESPADWLAQMGKLAPIQIHPLNRDFAAHRNAIKSVVPEGDWIIMLDADEWIMPGFIEAIHTQIVDNPDADSIFLERCNTRWEDLSTPVPPEPDYDQLLNHDYQHRGFRNLARIAFVGCVHEAMTGMEHTLHLKGKPYTLIHHKPMGEPRYAAWTTASK